RMEQIAPPDTILLAEETRRLAGPWIETTALGLRAVRGLSRQISVFELRGRAHPPSGWRFRDEQALALVGREAEQALLDQLLERSRADGARIIGVAGDAGVGKSRLCFEFVERCLAQGIRVCHIGGTAHGTSMPFSLLTEFLRTYLGITE